MGIADVAAVRALNTVYAAALEDSVTYRHDCPDNGWLAGQLGKEWVILLVAELDARIVGGLTAYELPKLEAARSEIYLYDLAVVETYRRRGIATSLIKEVQHIAAETGA